MSPLYLGFLSFYLEISPNWAFLDTGTIYCAVVLTSFCACLPLQTLFFLSLGEDPPGFWPCDLKTGCLTPEMGRRGKENFWVPFVLKTGNSVRNPRIRLMRIEHESHFPSNPVPFGWPCPEWRLLNLVLPPSNSFHSEKCMIWKLPLRGPWTVPAVWFMYTIVDPCWSVQDWGEGTKKPKPPLLYPPTTAGQPSFFSFSPPTSTPVLWH